MNILFLHRSFPAQFKYVAYELAKKTENKVIFITNTADIEVEGIEKIIYKVPNLPKNNTDILLKSYEAAVEHGRAAANEALKLKNTGFIPDVIYGHSGWGVAMFMKDVFPEVPLICYFEWFQNAEGADTGFGGLEITDEQKEGLRCANSSVLVDLYSSDGGISPTEWQKKQFPTEFHNKIKVIHDGIDTDFFKPNIETKFIINNKTFTTNDEIITYGTRGMEPYRGFPQFMEAIEKILKLRPSAKVLIAGDNKVCYRGRLDKGTYKELMLEKLDLDMDRVHFVGALPYVEYLKFLQISSVHVYLTVPYVLSWSCLEAMATGCLLVSSNTAPVLEVVKNNYNGLLADFYDVDGIANKICYALENKNILSQIRENARKTILDKYSLEKLLPEHLKYINSFICK